MEGYCQILFLRVYIEVLVEVYKLASVAGGISRASAFVLAAKPWTEVAKPWEDWWRVESPAMEIEPLARSRIPPATQAIYKLEKKNYGGTQRVIPSQQDSTILSARFDSPCSPTGIEV